ncbi:hypothetical protein AMTR_s00040p00229400 [Amborella trichopoda]|uniref:Uncharacterized protein n=1 Tax=Amborella trichopoda TaxID=13333 RepID=W1PYZ5_AMBTC|nr:hypothetical protein AMTR_s00040p00229400 [Amborella trichopoda]
MPERSSQYVGALWVRQSTVGVHIVTTRARIWTAGTQSSIAGALWLQRLHCWSELLECVVALPKQVIGMPERCGLDKVLSERKLGLPKCIFTVGK